MEHLDAILYHKIQESDFTNMYGVKKPTGGGGQTYIQAAGYSREELDIMFKDSDEIFDTPEYWNNDNTLPRKKYTFKAYEVGSESCASIELAPRTGRKDYRISRQNIKYRHPAWQSENGFPEPHCDNHGGYVFEKNYPGLIDNLYILILKTIVDDGSYKYYATYVKSSFLPSTWPSGAGLEEIFSKSKKQGIIFFDDQYLRFNNNKQSPFTTGSAADMEIDNVSLPDNLNEISDDAVEYSSKDISLDIDCNNIVVERVDPPTLKKKKNTQLGKMISKDIDYERRHKNLKKIGDIGETLAIIIEKKRLESEGRKDLSDQVEHVSRTIGDGLGYDIKSFDNIGGKYVEKFIEVKTTTGGKNKPFDISANEVAISEEKGEQYSIYRFYGVSGSATKIRFYEVRGKVSDNFTLEAVAYKAYYKK